MPDSLSPEQREELRRLAETATSGPWRRTKLQAGTGAAAFGRAIVNAEESGYPGAMLEGIRAEADAAYIAAASPDAVLALLALLALLDALDAGPRSEKGLREALERIAHSQESDLTVYAKFAEETARAALRTTEETSRAE